ncbi:MAG: hypothetical protein JRJ65_10865 [Deltaproteobacteria bacterium]|nr:hypothetical protein [Deltaproteobacteria bacterium]
MPVKHSVMLEPISEDEFHLLDHKIMEIVFSMVNNRVMYELKAVEVMTDEREALQVHH